MDNIDIAKHHNQKLAELPKNIIDMSVNSLRTVLNQYDVEQIKEAHSKDKDTWWAAYHHGWGTAIRNHLRDTVCLDDELPDKNWDDYYIPLVEIVCGIRIYD